MARKGTGKNQNQPQPQQAQSDAGPSSDRIAARAYEIYEREGRIDGRDLENWLKAEAELKVESEGEARRSNTGASGSAARMPSR